jgi:hypothetical protein
MTEAELIEMYDRVPDSFHQHLKAMEAIDSDFREEGIKMEARLRQEMEQRELARVTASTTVSSDRPGDK